MRWSMGLLSVAGLLMAACGGGNRGTTTGTARTGQPAETAAAPAGGATTTGATGGGGGGALTVPDWMKVDKSARTVSADVEAGKTPDNNHWNFNGYYNGNATITVPVGYKVRIQFTNHDPAVPHSIGVDSRTGDFPPTFTNPQPVFRGAISSNPTDPTKATAPGKSETISFTADKPGRYSLVCYQPGHAAAGMWVHFVVSQEGQAGVSTGS